MIAVDTNVLVRYLVRDDAPQAEAARRLLQEATEESPVFVSREVIVETVWVLERRYGFARSEIADVVVRLAGASGIGVEACDDVARSALSFARHSADFADLMILSAARRAGALPLYSFDHKLLKMPGAASPAT